MEKWPSTLYKNCPRLYGIGSRGKCLGAVGCLVGVAYNSGWSRDLNLGSRCEDLGPFLQENALLIIPKVIKMYNLVN